MDTRLTDRIRAYLAPRCGFTLLEVLITMAILAVGILGVSGLAVHTINGRGRSLELTQGTIAAQDRLEELKAAGYTNLGGFVGIEDYGTIPEYPDYWRKTYVQYDFPDPKMATITIIVKWKGGPQQQNKVSRVQTILSKPPGT